MARFGRAGQMKKMAGAATVPAPDWAIGFATERVGGEISVPGRKWVMAGGAI